MLIAGEQEMKGKVSEIHRSKGGLELSQQINAVMVSIKPGICSIMFKKYNKDMLTNYLEKINREGIIRSNQLKYDNYEDVETQFEH